MRVVTLPEPIRKFCRRLLLRLLYRLEGSEQEGFDVGGDGVPDADERAAMSAHKTAQKLSDAVRNEGNDSVAALLLSYELQFKIAKEQSSATYWAAVIGILSATAAALITASMQKTDDCAANQSTGKANSTASHAQPELPPPTARNIPRNSEKTDSTGN